MAILHGNFAVGQVATVAGAGLATPILADPSRSQLERAWRLPYDATSG
jgi:hypothetical protein